VLPTPELKLPNTDLVLVPPVARTAEPPTTRQLDARRRIAAALAECSESDTFDKFIKAIKPANVREEVRRFIEEAEALLAAEGSNINIKTMLSYQLLNSLDCMRG
jgi:hypothetical protein